MCKFYGVFRSGYYHHLQHKDIPSKDAALANMIAECQSIRGKIHGYRYVQLWLEKIKGSYRNPKTVLRIMRKYGLLSEMRRKHWHNYGKLLHRYANLLNRDFNAYKPNQKWVTDISYIPTAQGLLYLSVIRNLFDNSIVSDKISRQQTVNLVLDTVQAALQKEAVVREWDLHSDEAFQYTSQAYLTRTQKYGIIPSMSRRRNPDNNAMAENFFSMLKTECISRQRIQSFEQARLLMDDYYQFLQF